MKNLDDLHHFLGIQVVRSPSGLFLTQQKVHQSMAYGFVLLLLPLWWPPTPMLIGLVAGTLVVPLQGMSVLIARIFASINP